MLLALALSAFADDDAVDPRKIFDKLDPSIYRIQYSDYEPVVRQSGTTVTYSETNVIFPESTPVVTNGSAIPIATNWEDWWAKIPFLHTTSSVQELNQTISDTSLPPATRFTALASLFVEYVPARISSSELTNVLYARQWVDSMKISAEGTRVNVRPGFVLTLTNSLADWEDMVLPNQANEWSVPRLRLSLERGRKDTRTREQAVSFLQGCFPAELNEYVIYAQYKGLWVVFIRTVRLKSELDYDILQVRGKDVGTNGYVRLTRSTQPKKVQPSSLRQHGAKE